MAMRSTASKTSPPAVMGSVVISLWIPTTVDRADFHAETMERHVRAVRVSVYAVGLVQDAMLKPVEMGS